MLTLPKYHLEIFQQIIPPNTKYTVIKKWLTEQKIHQIYTWLISSDHLVALIFSTKTRSSPHGLNPIFVLTTSNAMVPLPDLLFGADFPKTGKCEQKNR